MNNKDLIIHCIDLQITLSDGDSKDINGVKLFEELIILRNIIHDTNTVLQMLSLLKKLIDSFPNTCIALRIILTMSVPSVISERSFLKLVII
jgi:hypothetical protein